MTKKYPEHREIWEKAGSLMGRRVRRYAKQGWFDDACSPHCCAVRKIDGCVVFIIGPAANANRIGSKIGFDPIKPVSKPFWERQTE